jgi:Helix-turn-helix domain
MPLVSKQIDLETYPDGAPIRSRYLRVQKVLDFYPFKRAKLYEYLASGDIKSFVLKEKGALRGIRLIDRDSLDAFLESHALRAEGKGSSR